MVKKTAVIYYGGFLSKTGGAFMHAKTIQGGLLRMGWDVSIITLDSLPVWCRYLPHLVLKFFNFFCNPLGFIYKGYAIKVLFKLFFDIKADIRIFEDIYFAWNSEVPSVTMIHAVWSDNLQAFFMSTEQQKRLKRFEADIINSLTHTVITVSQPYLEYLNKEHFSDYSLKKIDVVELGLEQSEFIGIPATVRNKGSIVYTGVLEARKNITFLLEVFKKLSSNNPAYKLTIIGDGPDKEELVSFAKNNDLNVVFLGRLEHEQVIIELRRHEIYLHASVKESFSYSLLEAKLSGLITCAYKKLQVPAEFIDVAMNSFDVDEWCGRILSIDMIPVGFESCKYTAERMTLSTLNLALPSGAR
ncbi:MAG: glycosyltransferase [Nitrospirae bacterium]|nr:MAG: glycosyltransferase [Nitrospirota bacterium]